MITDNTYQIPSISGHETAVKNRVTSFVESELIEGSERFILNKLKNYLHSAVDYVMNDLPSGVERVDGTIIKPILNEVISEKLSQFIVEEELVADEPSETTGEPGVE